MLDHVSIPVEDIECAAAFYDAVLATLDFQRLKQRDDRIGYGPPSRTAPVFWIFQRETGSAMSGIGLHISFQAGSRGAVDSFHAEALKYGAQDAGRPGWRPEYTMPFYGAYVIDADGYKIEAVCRLAK